MSDKFSVSFEKSGETVVIRLSGFFREHRLHPFSQVIEQAEAEHPSLIQLDLEQLRFVDSAALGCLLTLYHRCMQRETGLRLINVQDNLREVLHQTRLADVLDLGEPVVPPAAPVTMPAETRDSKSMPTTVPPDGRLPLHDITLRFEIRR